VIPQQLRQYPLIKVCQPQCKIESHGDCHSPGKRPARSVQSHRPIAEIRRWLEQDGNYGVVATSDNDLVILDSDTQEFADLVRRDLPDTFTVQTGSGNFHFYYQCGYSGNQNFRTEDGELGSVRVDNYHAVGPGSVHPETGQEYTVFRDRPIQPIPEAELSEFVEKIQSEDIGVKTGGGGGGSSRPTTASELDVRPSREILRRLRFINSDSKRREVAKVLEHDHPPRHIRVWMGGFLYSAVGLTESQLRRLLEELAGWATSSNRTKTEVESLVRSSVNNYRASESVDLDRYLGPDDMGGNTSESHKTEESGRPRTLQGGETNMDYTTKESFTVFNADSADEAEDGDRVVRLELTNMQGAGDDGEPVDTDFVTVTKGTLREDGEFGLNPQFPGQSKSVGSANPEDLRLIADGLEQIAEELDD
jgi:hypothetical protein